MTTDHHTRQHGEAAAHRFEVMQAAFVLTRTARTLDALADRFAASGDLAACSQAKDAADDLRGQSRRLLDSSGLAAATLANVAALTANPSTR